LQNFGSVETDGMLYIRALHGPKIHGGRARPVSTFSNVAYSSEERIRWPL